jgi:hypothetical protein
VVSEEAHVHAPACDGDHHLIEMPLSMQYRSHARQIPRDNRREFQRPSPDSLVADLQSALRQQIFDIAVAQGAA